MRTTKANQPEQEKNTKSQNDEQILSHGILDEAVLLVQVRGDELRELLLGHDLCRRGKNGAQRHERWQTKQSCKETSGASRTHHSTLLYLSKYKSGLLQALEALHSRARLGQVAKRRRNTKQGHEDQQCLPKQVDEKNT